MSDRASEPAPGARPAAEYVERLYAGHAAHVRSICRGLLRDRTEAEDAVQQTFLSAQRALVNGSSPREPAAWLATIARNECLARVRDRMREPLPVEAETSAVGGDTHTAAVRREEMGELRDALAGLPPQQREAILLRELRGFSYEEVANSLAVTTSAVESLLFRARRNLQAKLREAVAAFSPGGLLGRILGGGLGAPVAAKVVAVGTALVTGGAVLQTNVIGLGAGHVPRARPAAVAPVRSDDGAETSDETATARPTTWISSIRPATPDTSPREGSLSAHDGSQVETSDRVESTASGSDATDRTNGGGRPSDDSGGDSGGVDN